MPWLAVLVLALAACRFQLEADDPQPPPKSAQVQDPRCLDGGVWNDSASRCEYDDKRPPDIHSLSTAR